MRIYLIIIFFSLFRVLAGCSNLKMVTYNKPMTNAELVHYIRLIEHKKLISFENYLYRYGRTNHFNFYYNQPFYSGWNFKNYNRLKTVNFNNITQPKTGTTGNTLTTPSVLPPILNGNIKTKQ
tara:strand:+ start:4771 stop:5139 length:369 start_codon:yes stop_codon:yes gene_type:complete